MLKKIKLFTSLLLILSLLTLQIPINIFTDVHTDTSSSSSGRGGSITNYERNSSNGHVGIRWQALLFPAVHRNRNIFIDYNL